ncbi:MAG: PP2C family protein-serine/threonine phosphatase [Planctomycetota bacterium]
MPDTPEIAVIDADSAHELRCVEIWGGSSQAHEAASVPGLDITVSSRVHGGDDAGGDVYFVSMCGAGNVSRIGLADVAGHGASAADLSARLARLMRKHINTPDPAKLAKDLNHEFETLQRAGRFATALLATYLAPTDELVLVNAGHPPPALYKQSRGSWSFLTPEAERVERGDGIGDLPLGVIGDTDYTRFSVVLDPGDRVVLYSDALPEAVLPDGSQLGQDGLLRVLASIRPGPDGDLGADVLAALAEQTGADLTGDDATVIAINHNAQDPPAHALGQRLGMLGRMMGIGEIRRTPDRWRQLAGG